MLNPNIFANLANGQTASGEVSMNDVAALQKALTTGYGTDVAGLTGGAALRIQSLEKTMLSTIQENKHFRLFNALQKTSATATVDEWTEQSSVGGFRGGSTNSETGVINQATGQYARRVGMVKFLMTMRQVSFVASLQNSIVDAEATEQQAGALQLLSDAEYLSFEGNSAVVPTEFDGLFTQLSNAVNTGTIDGTHVIDNGGTPLNSIVPINTAAASIAGPGNFGTPTDIFCSNLVQSDFDSSLDPAFRVALDSNPGSLQLGAPVKGIRTSWGDIKNQPDVFIRDEAQQRPFEVDFPTVAAANVAFKPASLTVDATGSSASSTFTAVRAGNYYYAVTGVNASGETQAVISAQVAIAAGKAPVLTIGRSGAATETGYVIYRGRLNGTNALTDLRFMARIPASGGATTTYTDLNTDIPGTSRAYILNLNPSAMAITWRQFLPMFKFPLYATNSAVIPWAQMLFGYLRLGKLKHHVVIKNILPSGAVWRPFN